MQYEDGVALQLLEPKKIALLKHARGTDQTRASVWNMQHSIKMMRREREHAVYTLSWKCTRHGDSVRMSLKSTMVMQRCDMSCYANTGQTKRSVRLVDKSNSAGCDWQVTRQVNTAVGYACAKNTSFGFTIGRKTAQCVPLRLPFWLCGAWQHNVTTSCVSDDVWKRNCCDL